MSDKTFIVEVEARKAMKTLIVGLELEAVWAPVGLPRIFA